VSTLAPYIGGIAALLPRRVVSTEDLSLAMLAALTLGLALWILYGAIQGD